MATHTPSKLWHYDAYALIPSDGRRHEIIDGEHFVNPAPNLYHQTVLRRMLVQLYGQVELAKQGVVFCAPVDLQLSDHDIVQPDLVAVSEANRHILTPAKIRGIPDLVVEILSPSNSKHDTVVKRATYLRCGVTEYWIVDPSDHSLLQLVLKDGEYSEEMHRESVSTTGAFSATVNLLTVWGDA